jgi:hypothetical protein
VEHSERVEATTDLTGNLLLHPSLCRRLMEPGREGVVASRQEIQRFFAGDRPPLPPPAR